MWTEKRRPSSAVAALVRHIKWQTVLGLLFVSYAVLMTVPWSPHGFAAGLDESYKVALNTAVASDIQFGRDFVYTYGPYGILQHERYFPQTYTFLLIGRAFVGFVTGIGVFRIAVYCWRRSRQSVLFLIPAFLSFRNSGISEDGFYTYFMLLPLLLYFHVEFYVGQSTEENCRRGAPSFLIFLTVLGLGLASLIKQTYLVLSCGIIFLIAVDQLFRRRQAPTLLLTYLVSVFGFWLLAGQRLTSVGVYLFNNAQIVKGFSETMGVSDPEKLVSSTVEILLYIAIAIVLLAILAVTVWPRNHRRTDNQSKRSNLYRWLPVLGLALVLFLSFKGAFTRHDGHAIQSSEVTILLASLYSALLWPRLKSLPVRLKRFRVSVPFVCLLWLLVVVNAQVISLRYAPSLYRDRYLGAVENISTTVGNAVSLTQGKANLQSIFDKSVAQVRADNPLPEVEGTADLYPNDIAVLVSHDLTYRPRPVIQSFSAYTGYLAALNAAHLKSDRAAQTILFDVRTIDGRLPSSDDGRSWPELLTQYEITDVSSSYLVLKRRQQPTRYTLTPQVERDVEVGEWVDVSNLSSLNPVWMNIDIPPTVTGKAMTMLLRRPQLSMEVELANGFTEKYHVFEDVMSEGQMLSPFITDRHEFAALAALGWQDKLASVAVNRIRLVTSGVASLAYPSVYTLKLSSLEFPRQDLSDIPGWTLLENFMRLKNGRAESLNGKQPVVYRGPQGKSVLLAQPSTRISLPLAERSKRLDIHYGLLEAAWQNADAPEYKNTVDGVEFQISAVTPSEKATDSTEKVLFSQWIDPRDPESSRKERQVSVSLEDINATSIVLETRPGPNNNDAWDLSYWTSLDIR